MSRSALSANSMTNFLSLPPLTAPDRSRRPDKRGVDDFRVDAGILDSENPEYPDADVVDEGAEFQRAEKHHAKGPGMYEWLKEMRRESIDKYGEKMLIGELPHTESRVDMLSCIPAVERELSNVFDFDAVDLGNRETA